MNKKLLTAAIAAAIAAPATALANDVTIYGVVHASVDYRNEDDASRRISVWTPNGTWVERSRVKYGLFGDNTDGFDVVSRATRLGFKGTEDLANGLKAIWKMEFQVDIADRGGSCWGSSLADWQGSLGSPTLNTGNVQGVCDSGGLITARNAYIGLAGGWGTFLVGRHDTPYKMSTGNLDLFADTLADYNSTIGFVDLRVNSAIAYVSPSWNGLSFAGAVVAPHVYSAGYDRNGVWRVADADGLAEAYSLALTWNGMYGLFASVAYESINGKFFDAWIPAPTRNSENNDKVRVGLGWTGAGFTVGGLYEWEDNVLGTNNNAERWQILAGYTFGNNMIKAMYGQGDLTGSTNYVYSPYNYGTERVNGDRSAWAVGLDHNFSKRTKAYMLYTAVDGDLNTRTANWNGAAQTAGMRVKDDVNYGGFSIGMIHSF